MSGKINLLNTASQRMISMEVSFQTADEMNQVKCFLQQIFYTKGTITMALHEASFFLFLFFLNKNSIN